MIVVCKIETVNRLTLGKKYEVLDIINWTASLDIKKSTEYKILCDDGLMEYFSESIFKTLSEVRKNKLKKI